MPEPYENEHTSSPEPLVPPTPVTPEAYQPKRRHGDSIGIGILLGILMDVVVTVLVSTISALAEIYVVALLAILLLGYGGSAALAYRTQRPLLARGLFIMLGITIGLPLLAFGVCMAIWRLG